MTSYLVAVDPIWFDSHSCPSERPSKATNARSARRADQLRRIARACLEVGRSGSERASLDTVWRSLANGGRFDSACPSVDDGDVRILPSLGAFLVDGHAARWMRREALLGLHVVDDASFVASGPFSEESSGDTAWHVESVRGTSHASDGGEGVVVGILDTGIDASHPEFRGVDVAYSAFDEAGAVIAGPARDYSIHGTHVAGVVAGSTCGIAPRASLAVAAVMSPKGSAIAFASGLDWLLTSQFGRSDGARGVDVINASVGFAADHPRMRMLIRRALSEHRTLMIAASGNDGASGPNRCAAPARFPETLAVGAVDGAGVVASFSAYGSYAVSTQGVVAKPEISAPGVGIRSSIPNGRYRSLSATSMACPIVSGAAAVILSRRPELRSHPKRLRAALLDAAKAPIRSHPRFGNTGGVGAIAV